MIHPREFTLAQKILEITNQELVTRHGSGIMTIRLQVGEAGLYSPGSTSFLLENSG